MWPLVITLGLFLALGTISGSNFAAPAEAEIVTILADVRDCDEDEDRCDEDECDDCAEEEVAAVWWFMPDDFSDDASDCSDDDQLVAAINDEFDEVDDEDVIFLFNEPGSGEDDRVWICVEVDSDDEPLEFDADDYGSWEEAICAAEDNDDCSDTNGLGTDTLTIHCDLEPICDDDDESDDGDVAALFVCEDDDAGEATITITQGEPDDPDGLEEVQFRIICLNEVDEVDGDELTCVPCEVEIVPALGNTQYALIYAKLLDEDGDAAAFGREVTWTTDNCEVAESTDDSLWEDVLDDDDEDLDTFDEIIDIFEEFENSPTPENADDIADFVDDFFDPEWDDEASEEETFLEEPFDEDDPFEDLDTFAATILNCGQGHDSEPGVAEVCLIVEIINDPDIVECVEVTVTGSPATLTVTADPTSVRCGERSQVTVTVRDAEGEPVSDHTLVEAVTNFGGVLGGTGAVAGQQGLVTPVGSTLAETINGVATFWLLTSETHSGPYEILVTTGGGGAVAGTIGFDEDDEDEDDFSSNDEDEDTDDDEDGIDEGDDDDEVFDFDEDDDDTQTLGGLFSTGVLNGRVQVSCTIPAIAAPAAPAPQADVRAPRTGQGIVPPNTGDAGLADASGSSLALFVIGGVAVFALAGVAGLKFARR